MGARIQSIAEASRDKWLSVAGDCSYATYFHTPYWYEMIVPGQKHIALEVRFDDGASAIIPVAEIKRAGGLLVDRFSSPGGNYGGWISASPLGREHIKMLADVLMSKKNLTFRINPFCESIGISNIKGFADDHTHIVDLTKGETAIYSGIHKGHRDAIRYAERNGVTVRAARTLEEWDKHYDLYLSSVKRWRAGGLASKTVYPRSLIRRIYENQTGNETLWLALKDGEPIAGSLAFYWGRHAVSWHGAASAEHFRLRPNNLLYWKIISDAAGRGCAVYDFNPSGGYGGVESFKDYFGAARVPSPVLSVKTPLRSLASRVRAALRPSASPPSSS